ncbi:uncharacterized protein EV154DRAFT_504023 [Mucor mucedo]|uniref:uncharacterized protein n=1 Tax=Mucor mucedo TaxID=29922 RepID=UPI00221F8742|nr:uncharacterized protein EV154DRAFT_504023 [Mucor mucedo]KAI7892767.1 hypothetical protein EV154DRAFT_504023 [Mucor mucedo]
MNSEIHIPYLSQEEKLFLNTTATYSKARRMSHSIDEDHHHHHQQQQQQQRRQVVSVSSLAFLWKRRGSSSSSLLSSSSSRSMDFSSQFDEEESPKAKELESLIFDQPQRTVRLSLTPRCAV